MENYYLGAVQNSLLKLNAASQNNQQYMPSVQN